MIDPEREAAIQSLERKDWFKLPAKWTEHWACSKAAANPPHTFCCNDFSWGNHEMAPVKQPKGEAATYWIAAAAYEHHLRDY